VASQAKNEVNKQALASLTWKELVQDFDTNTGAQQL